MTAIEWYFKQMQSKEHFTQDEFNKIFSQAKEMEKQQKDDYAIEFYKWMIDNIHIFNELSIWNKEHKKYSEKEILEIFKKEKCY
jgi:hypothetical protein